VGLPISKTPALPEPARKPVQAVMREDCYCTHSADDHRGPAGLNERGGPCTLCACEHYLRRPCVCAHLAGGHNGACLVRGCKCKAFRQDNTPEVLLRAGVRAGDVTLTTTARLRFLQRPDIPVRIRIWATGLLHADRQRLAVKRDENGNLVPLTPADIVRELNALDTIPCAINCRREFRALEQMGGMRRVGGQSNMRLYFYLKPLPNRYKEEDAGNLAHVDRSVHMCWKSSMISGSYESYLQDVLIMPAKKALVKLFLKVLTETHEGGVVTEADRSVQIERALGPVTELLKSVLEGLLQPPAANGDSVNVSNAPADPPDRSVRLPKKTETPSPGNDVLKGQSVSQSEATDRPTDSHKKKNTQNPSRVVQIEEIIKRWVSGHVSEEATPELCQRIDTALAGADLPQFVQAIQKKLHKIKSLGFLEHLARDCAKTQDAWRATQAGDGSADEAEAERAHVTELLADPKRMKLARAKEVAEHPLTKIERLALEQTK
jgi:hypothetical protein